MLAWTHGVYPVEVKQGIDWRFIGSVATSLIAITALVLFVLGVLNDQFGAPPPPPSTWATSLVTSPSPPTPVQFMDALQAFLLI